MHQSWAELLVEAIIIALILLWFFPVLRGSYHVLRDRKAPLSQNIIVLIARLLTLNSFASSSPQTANERKTEYDSSGWLIVVAFVALIVWLAWNGWDVSKILP